MPETPDPSSEAMPTPIQKNPPPNRGNLPHFSTRLLAKARERKQLSRSQLHLALAHVGVERCRALIDAWHAGTSQPRASDLVALATVLEVPMESFFEIEPVATE
jgi:hypothetical protein